MSTIENKIDFAVILSVKNANPNGDPLNGNRPRENYDGHGEISDVCLKNNAEFIVPSLSLCGDNAVMTAAAGYHMFRLGIKADSKLNAFASDESSAAYLDSLKHV